jgi:hypothetical protein
VVISTPRVCRYSGCPGAFEPRCAVPPGPRSPARIRTGTTGCRASGWCAWPRARTGPGPATGRPPDRGPAHSGTRDTPAAPGSSPSRDARFLPSGPRPGEQARSVNRTDVDFLPGGALSDRLRATDPGNPGRRLTCLQRPGRGVLLVHDSLMSPESGGWLCALDGPGRLSGLLLVGRVQVGVIPAVSPLAAWPEPGQ